jgi:predicted enzyme related to lactoylglutathione lyase
MGNPVVHWELWSEEPERAASFYGNVFGWAIRPIPEMNYHVVEAGGESGIGGGIMKPQEGPWPGNMTFYIDVEDLGASLDKVVAAGGRVVVKPTEVPGVGSMALFADPDGRVIGLWKQRANADG